MNSCWSAFGQEIQHTSPRTFPTEDALFEGAGQRKRFRLANCWCGDHQDPHAFHYEGVAVTTTSSSEHDEAHLFGDREVVLNREDIRRSDGPDIVLTTLESLELFGLKPNYSLIDEIDAIVFDEVHLYTGIRGAHAANIIENIEEITDHSTLWLERVRPSTTPSSLQPRFSRFRRSD